MTGTANEPARAGRALSSAGALLYFAQVLLPAAALVGLFGVGRLGRQFPAAASTPALLVPFLLPVLALALEAGGLVAFSSVTLRCYRDLPLRPRARRWRALVPVLLALSAVLAMAEALPRGTERPGAFANELVASARAGCGDDEDSVPVPLLGLSVECQRDRIVGPMPGVAAVQVAMQSLSFSDDLRRVEIADLELSVSRKLTVKLSAKRARISGLSPWARSAQLLPLHRFLVLAAAALCLSLAAAWWWRPATGDGEETARGQRLLRLALGALPGALAALVVIRLDQAQAPAPAYLLAAASAVASLGALAVLRAHLKTSSYFARL